MAKEKIFTSKIKYAEIRLNEDIIKLLDAAAEKIKHCKMLASMNLIPLMRSDTGIDELIALNSHFRALGELRAIQLEVDRDKCHARRKYKENSRQNKKS